MGVAFDSLHDDGFFRHLEDRIKSRWQSHLALGFRHVEEPKGRAILAVFAAFERLAETGPRIDDFKEILEVGGWRETDFGQPATSGFQEAISEFAEIRADLELHSHHSTNRDDFDSANRRAQLADTMKRITRSTPHDGKKGGFSMQHDALSEAYFYAVGETERRVRDYGMSAIARLPDEAFNPALRALSTEVVFREFGKRYINTSSWHQSKPVQNTRMCEGFCKDPGLRNDKEIVALMLRADHQLAYRSGTFLFGDTSTIDP